MAEFDALRRKTSPAPLARNDHDAARPLARATQSRALPSVRALLQAGALVSAAAALGAGAVACGQHGDGDASKIAPDEPSRGRNSMLGFVTGIAASATGLAANPTTSATLVPTNVPVPLGGAAPPHMPVPLPTASATITGSKVGLATPPPVRTTSATATGVPTPQRVPGGPMIASPPPLPPSAVPRAPGGKPRAVVPWSPGGASTAQAPCPQPNGAPGTI
jgi:hypothetical protein